MAAQLPKGCYNGLPIRGSGRTIRITKRTEKIEEEEVKKRNLIG